MTESISPHKEKRTMRKTLHEYIDGFDSDARSTRDALTDFAENVTNYAKLTNRAPRLGDFIECDEEGNVLEEPQEFEYIFGLGDKPRKLVIDPKYQTDLEKYQAAKSRVIFKGDWKVVKGSNSNHTRIYCEQLNTTIDFEWSGVSLIRTDRSGFVLQRGAIDRIEDLPREIEFKDGVI